MAANKKILALVGIGILGVILLIRGILKAVKNVSGLSLPVRPAILRKDSQGDGSFGACRDNCSRKHQGLDLVVKEGQPVYAPIAGYVSLVYPYASDKRWSGCQIKNDNGDTVRLYYLNPNKIGKQVAQGEIVGYAQAISKKYSSAMTDHIHVEYRKNGQLIDVTPYLLG